MVSKPVVLLSGPEDDNPTEVAMRFRLYYQGELRPTQRDPINDQKDPLAPHKHRVRQVFHAQLKQLWNTNRFLREHTISKNSTLVRPTVKDETAIRWTNEKETDLAPMAEVIANRYHEFGYRFVPLVREQISLLCSLKILFLRRDPPGSVIQAGDIDNRIKTLIDALRRPRNATELVEYERPGEGEDPFFVLMEDDKQVTHLEVETDTLLDPLTGEDADHRKVRLIITVDLRPYDITLFNLSFA